jgi:hypothetical protein
MENVDNIKKITSILFVVCLLVECFSDSKYMVEDENLSIELSQKAQMKKLYQFYNSQKNDLEYFEIGSRKYLYTLNYNPKLKVLLIYNSDAWQAIYKFVDEASLKRVYEANVPFNKYDSLLTRELHYNYKKMGKIKTGRGY